MVVEVTQCHCTVVGSLEMRMAVDVPSYLPVRKLLPPLALSRAARPTYCSSVLANAKTLLRALPLQLFIRAWVRDQSSSIEFRSLIELPEVDEYAPQEVQASRLGQDEKQDLWDVHRPPRRDLW